MTNDSETRAEYLGREIETLLGYTREELGPDLRHWLRVIHPDDVDNVRSSWRAAIESQERFDVEFRVRRADGRVIWVRNVAAPIRDRPATWVSDRAS